MDGDIEHHGRDLKNFLKRNKLAKQINKATRCPEYGGGMEDLAGELFCFLKTKTKEVMPAHPDTNNDYAFEYEIGFFEGCYNGGNSTLYIKVKYWDTPWKII